MNGREKSDPVIVAVKSPNKTGQPAAEAMERRRGTEGNACQHNTRRAQNRESVTQALERVRQAARTRKKERFTALLHHVDIDLLRTAFFALQRAAAPGVDGLTWPDYQAELEPRLAALHDRVQRGAYRPQPSRRTYIPKADGKQRPLAIAALEDKIVQSATAMVMNAIYEEDFLGFSYGFRPGRGPHDALDALVVGIDNRKVNYILDADIRSFFDTVDQQWLVRFLEHRIGDKRIIRLAWRWLKAGILEDGAVAVSDRGTGQGSVISPLFANIYLHYVLDLWAERWRRREATGDMIIVRYADDVVAGFEHEDDARRFVDAMRVRFEAFALSLHPDKTRLIEFGRHAAVRRERRGLGKPETFNFLGFTFICGIQPEKVRYHWCWGSWHGAHVNDIPLEHIIDIALKVKAQTYSFEAANVRHQHEMEVWKETKLAPGTILMPGVISHATNIVEHPELIARRLVDWAGIVGRENVVGGADCGMGGRVHAEIGWTKLAALAEGAALATKTLWH